MTVGTTESIRKFTVTGSESQFDFSFSIVNTVDLEVIFYNPVNIKTPLTLTTHYTITPQSVGGTLYKTANFPSGTGTLVIKRKTPILQNTRFVENQKRPSKVTEDAFDKNILICQEIKNELSGEIAAALQVTNLITVTRPINLDNFATPNFGNKVITFDDFGAIGDGNIANKNVNSNAIILALQKCVEYGYKEIRFSPNKNYVIRQRINLSANSGLTIIQDGAIITPAEITTADPRFDIYFCQGTAADITTGTLLSADRLKNAFNITTTAPIAGATKGKWLEIWSDGLLSGSNPTGSKYRIARKIYAVSGNTYYFDRPLDYDFLTSHNAKAGLCTYAENIRLVNPRVGDDAYDDTIGQYQYIRQFARGINFSRVNNVKIESPHIQGNKTRDEPSPDGGRTGINIANCQQTTITDAFTKNLLGYGISSSGHNENMTVRGLYGNDVRHTFDGHVWASTNGLYIGESNNISFADITSEYTTHSGVSTHAGGRNISAYNVNVSFSGTQEASFGAIIRNDNFNLTKGLFQYNTLDGVSQKDDADNAVITNVTCQHNARVGFNNGKHSTLNGCHALKNSLGGMSGNSIQINGGSSVDNTYAVIANYYEPETRLFEINNLYMPYSADQVIGVLIEPNFNTNNLILNNNDCTGYGDFLFSIPTGQQDFYYPRTNGRNKLRDHTVGGETFGVVDFASASTEIINTSSIRRLWSSATGTRGRYVSEIKLTVIEASVSVTVSSRIRTSSVSFEITASAACKVRWEITGV